MCFTAAPYRATCAARRPGYTDQWLVPLYGELAGKGWIVPHDEVPQGAHGLGAQVTAADDVVVHDLLQAALLAPPVGVADELVEGRGHPERADGPAHSEVRGGLEPARRERVVGLHLLHRRSVDAIAGCPPVLDEGHRAVAGPDEPVRLRRFAARRIEESRRG